MSGGQSTDFQSRFFENNSMDKDEAHPVECKLVSFDADLKLDKMAKNDKGYYISLVILPANMLMIVDNKACNLRLYRRDGKLLAKSDKLQSQPWDVCLINATEVAVILFDGQIEIMSFDTTTITRQKTLYTSGFDKCHAVKILGSLGTCVVSGRKQDNISWGIVSLDNGHVNTVHKICEGKFGVSYLATSPYNTCTMVYVSCDAGPFSRDTGLYGFDINTGTRKVLYRHKELENPRGVSVDTRDSVYVCNWGRPSCIHQLNELGNPVTIHREGMPPRLLAMYFEKQQEKLFVTSFESNEVRIYKPEYKDHQVLPAEILRMDEKSKQLFQDALKKGEEKVYNIRVMVVGHCGVGKTTLIKRLLGKNVNIHERCATEGIDVDMHCCDVSVKTFEWKVRQPETEDSKEDALIMRVAKVVSEETPKAKVNDQLKQEKHASKNYPDNEKHDRVISSTVENQVNIIKEDEKSESIEKIPSTDFEEKQLEVRGSPNADLNGDMLHLLCQKAPKLPQSTDEHASLAVWDFAGQFAFYTTHQTFMTRRAIYLLVSDVSDKFDNAVYDECYLDSRGKIQCRVRDLVDVWMNSIHSCASSSEEGIPPVILVGTHVDLIRQSNRHEFCESYFKEVRTYLKDKPSRFHLVNEEFAINNTVVDSKLENLKTKIIQVASHQKYWGEKIPAQWLLLEQALMKLKRDGIKVIPRSMLEGMAATHEIDTDQLELFLRFQNDIGMILYFSIETLKEKIVLDPRWMIDAIKSLINANDMVVMRNNPKVSDKVLKFKDYGILYQDLIDAIWTKEKCQEFHDNKEHIILLMEQLNIIARPRLYIASEIKVENYFLVPCMVHQAAPREIINPKPHSEMGSSSVLCYVFVGKCLPTPIFNRLLAACLAEWPLAKTNSKNLIFCGCSVFEVDPCHDLTLHFKDYVIFLRVTKMSKTDKTPDSDICIKVKDFISMNLSKLTGDQCQSLKFDWYIQCTLSEADCLDGMIPVTRLSKSKESVCSSHGTKHVVVSHDLLKFWFKDEKLLDAGDGAVQKWPKLLQTKKLASSTKSKAVLPTQQSSNTTTRPSVQTPSKQTKHKKEVPAALTSAKNDSPPSILPSHIQDKIPLEKQLNRLSMLIGKEFLQLGLELDVSMSRIEQIQMENPTISMRCFKILQEWVHKNAAQATYRNLERACRCVGIDVSILKTIF